DSERGSSASLLAGRRRRGSGPCPCQSTGRGQGRQRDYLAGSVLNFSSRANGLLLSSVIVVLAILVVRLPDFASPQTTNAQAAYEQALGLLQNGKNDEALAVVDAAIAAGASDPALYNLRGLANSALGHDEEAEKSFRTLIRLAPTSAMGYTNLGVLLSKAGRHEDAVTAFREAQTLEPKNFTALLGLGTSLEALHKHAEAAIYL